MLEKTDTEVKSVPSDVDGETLENLSTMRTEILSLYSQPGGSIAVQKSQLVNLTPKDILDMADSTFGQMHTLVACLEVRDGQVQKMQHRSKNMLHSQLQDPVQSTTNICKPQTTRHGPRQSPILAHFSSGNWPLSSFDGGTLWGDDWKNGEWHRVLSKALPSSRSWPHFGGHAALYIQPGGVLAHELVQQSFTAKGRLSWSSSVFRVWVFPTGSITITDRMYLNLTL